ncbi:MAG: alkaline phosphatase D family protein [Chitinophagales bacterium]|nr:alkaline phosphatase D family protein [Chitinophagales bacterium]
MLKNLLIFSITYFSFFALQGQDYNLPERSYVNPALAPFYHGVASGDATEDKVIIWTRITTDAPSADVIWRMATDSLFRNVVDTGVFHTDASRDFTVKVDVVDLEPDTWYFYEFEDGEGHLSQRGRTKTIPVENVNNFRAAVVACASYPHGFFNVYNDISKRNDINAVIHLGDYIYEYGLNEYGSHKDRVPQPENDIVSLSDYRTRYSQAHLDTMLQKVHQQYPFYLIWDDHEFADNSWRDGANNHDPSRQGDWSARKSAAMQAYYEWVPIREINPDNKFRIYRNLKIGSLLEIFFLDTRMIDRDNENDPDGPNKRMIGPVQMEWLQRGLKNSTAQWKVLAQQVMMTDMTAFGLVLNSDQWDGYQYERRRLFDFINANDIKNLVVLTGDIHTFWANDLPFGKEKYDPISRMNSAGVEFICSAVSSPGLPQPIPSNLIGTFLPHVRFTKMDKRGYILFDVNSERAQGDYMFAKTIYVPDTTIKYQNSWYTNDLTGHLSMTRTPSVADFTNIPFVPRGIRDKNATPTAVKDQKLGVAMGAYPNPFISTVGLQYYVEKASHLRMQVFNMSGQLLIDQDLGMQPKGLHYQTLTAGQLPAGQYRINVTDGTYQIGRNVIKAQ